MKHGNIYTPGKRKQLCFAMY